MTILKILLSLLIIVLAILGPFIAVWTVNTCFHTDFAIKSFVEWFAWVLLGVLVRGSYSRKE
ncbi:hypothetical protein [Xanthomonas phage XAJ2]|uniref:Uncharacterized protein n=1 Tax=Xanthomonas phage XAJ2 TaxID=1775249 RepID=A0A1I9L2G4_9CAUD|nr:hypothetical protein [Xanthomonas phage XAJ2]